MLNNFIALLYADSEFPCKTCLAHKRCRTTVHQFFVQPDFVMRQLGTAADADFIRHSRASLSLNTLRRRLKEQRRK